METNISFDEFSRRYFLGRNCSRRIVKEVQIAIKSWALFNAMNGNENHSRKDMQASLKQLQLSDKMVYMRLVMAFDTLMAIFRVTDQKSKDNLTFCNLAIELADAEFLDEMIQYNKNEFSKLGTSFEQKFEDNSRKYVKEYLDTFPLNWNKTKNLSNKKIFEFRNQYKPLRDNFLAHSGMQANLEQPTIDETSQTIELLAIQASQVHYIYLCNYEPLNDFSKIQHKESLELWNSFEEGLSRVVNTDKTDSSKK